MKNCFTFYNLYEKRLTAISLTDYIRRFINFVYYYYYYKILFLDNNKYIAEKQNWQRRANNVKP